jgi:hypothetical protein
MSYDSYRTTLVEAYYAYQLQSLLTDFDPAQKTVILLPGGMGSQLERTDRPYPEPAGGFTDVVWINLGIAGEFDALKLEIDPAGHDKDAHVVGAHGPVRFRLFGLTPYDELQEFAEMQGWNFHAFGFDWRRPIAESAGAFKQFIADFRQSVIDGYGSRYDPIPNLTIVCHSMGGLVCTHALRDSAFSALGFNAVVTIATPFYGTANQQQRYFVGIPPLLNKIYGAQAVARVTASMPGPFTLLYLPKSIYARDGAKLGLSRYPEYDPDSKAEVDPYDPANLHRWPKPVRDHAALLLEARRAMEEVAAPIDAGIAPRFFNVRASGDLTTAVELEWRNVDGDSIVPGQTPSPLASVPGPGDGTVPAWSAWHAHCRSANTHQLQRSVDHATLLESAEVLDVIDSLVTSRKLPAVTRRVARVFAASDEEVADVTKAWIDAVATGKKLPAQLASKPVQRAIWRSLIAGPKPEPTSGSAASKPASKALVTPKAKPSSKFAAPKSKTKLKSKPLSKSAAPAKGRKPTP